jgi:hypothetical protein
VDLYSCSQESLKETFYREAVKDVTRNEYSILSSIRADGAVALTARNPARAARGMNRVLTLRAGQQQKQPAVPRGAAGC